MSRMIRTLNRTWDIDDPETLDKLIADVRDNDDMFFPMSAATLQKIAEQALVYLKEELTRGHA